MSVKALGYLGFGVSDIAAWRDYMSHILGCHVEDQNPIASIMQYRLIQ